MSSTTGKSWVIGRYATSTFYPLGGIAFDVKVDRKSSTTKQPGTGQRKLASTTTSGIYYVIDFKLKVQILASFITSYCMITAEGALPSFGLYVDDGITKRGFTGCYVNTCNLEVDQAGALVASIQVIAIANEDKTLTGTSNTEAPMSKASVTAFTLGGNPLSKWTKIGFSINNNVEVLSTGNGVAMTEIFAKQAEYSGSIDFVKTAALAYGYTTTQVADLVITLVDNQSSPATVTFTFDDVRANSDGYMVQELGITREKIDWDGDEVAIS